MQSLALHMHSSAVYRHCNETASQRIATTLNKEEIHEKGEEFQSHLVLVMKTKPVGK